MPWQSEQCMVCVPTLALKGVRTLSKLALPRSTLSLPVGNTTGCHERWLTVLAAAPELVSQLAPTGVQLAPPQAVPVLVASPW